MSWIIEIITLWRPGGEGGSKKNLNSIICDLLLFFYIFLYLGYNCWFSIKAKIPKVTHLKVSRQNGSSLSADRISCFLGNFSKLPRNWHHLSWRKKSKLQLVFAESKNSAKWIISRLYNYLRLVVCIVSYKTRFFFKVWDKSFME